jgi:hypothetical protein
MLNTDYLKEILAYKYEHKILRNYYNMELNR